MAMFEVAKGRGPRGQRQKASSRTRSERLLPAQQARIHSYVEGGLYSNTQSKQCIVNPEHIKIPPSIHPSKKHTGIVTTPASRLLPQAKAETLVEEFFASSDTEEDPTPLTFAVQQRVYTYLVDKFGQLVFRTIIRQIH